MATGVLGRFDPFKLHNAGTVSLHSEWEIDSDNVWSVCVLPRPSSLLSKVRPRFCCGSEPMKFQYLGQ